MLIHHVKPEQAEDLAYRIAKRYGDGIAQVAVPFWVHALGYPMRARDRAALRVAELEGLTETPQGSMSMRYPRLSDLAWFKRAVRLTDDAFELVV